MYIYMYKMCITCSLLNFFANNWFINNLTDEFKFQLVTNHI